MARMSRMLNGRDFPTELPHNAKSRPHCFTSEAQRIHTDQHVTQADQSGKTTTRVMVRSHQQPIIVTGAGLEFAANHLQRDDPRLKSIQAVRHSRLRTFRPVAVVATASTSMEPANRGAPPLSVGLKTAIDNNTTSNKQYLLHRHNY